MNNKMEPYVINLKTELFNIKGHFAYKLFGAKHFRTVECVTFTTKSCKSQESVTKEVNLRLSRAGQDLKDHPVWPVSWRTCNRPKACPRPFTHREDYRPVQNSFPPYYGILPFFCWNSMTNSGVCMLLFYEEESMGEPVGNARPNHSLWRLCVDPSLTHLSHLTWFLHWNWLCLFH